MDLRRAFRVNKGDCLAFSGAGGKTTAISLLARQLDPPVLVTTTTHLAVDQLSLADQVFRIGETTNIEELLFDLPAEVILLVGEETEDQRVMGLGEKKLQEVYTSSKNEGISLLIEADGSRLHPLKAPADHEPVIPSFVDGVVVVSGLSALGKPLMEDWVHRADRFAQLAGLGLGEPISTEAITRVSLNPSGGLKEIPVGARRLCLLNQADNPMLQAQGNRIARSVTSEYAAVIVAALTIEPRGTVRTGREYKLNGSIETGEIFAVHEPVAGIILAAGGSERMGRPKQLLPWHGEPLICHATRTALSAGLDQVVVVVGAFGEEVKEALVDQDVDIRDNPDWKLGQSTSVRAGLSALPPGTGAVLFLLADQPNIPAMLIQALIEKHAETLAPIVAPLIDNQRGNPVLFDRQTFKDLFSVRGDSGGRQLFSQYPVTWVEWHDGAVLLDIDTDEDYQRLLAEVP